MNKIEIIKYVRELQGFSKAQLSKIVGLSSGTISKLDTRDSVLSEETLDSVLAALKVESVNGDFRFIDGAFVRVIIKDFLIPNYQPLFDVLDKYNGVPMTAYMVDAEDINIVDRTTFDTLQRVLPEIPATYAVIKVGDGLIIYLGRKHVYYGSHGYHGYLTYRNFLTGNLRTRYRARIVDVRDKNIAPSKATEALVKDFLRRHET